MGVIKAKINKLTKPTAIKPKRILKSVSPDDINRSLKIIEL